ncbi:MAG TPA: SDR family oxidoreductase, partial [Pseudomonadales bacterium]|nr:SDR family oxidoreductase [Pseudomonadales bacterium]
YIISSGMDTYEGSTKALLPTLKNTVPLKRLGTESEVSAAICFLLSDAAAFITGTSLRIDGGAPLGTALFQIPENQHPFTYNGFHRAVTPDVFKDEA